MSDPAYLILCLPCAWVLVLMGFAMYIVDCWASDDDTEDKGA